MLAWHRSGAITATPQRAQCSAQPAMLIEDSKWVLGGLLGVIEDSEWVLGDLVALAVRSDEDLVDLQHVGPREHFLGWPVAVGLAK
jgi:hypothetical protein